MSLKRSYTISFDADIAKKIEAVKEKTRKSYKEIFLEAIETYLEGFDTFI